jgi:hypothetical protein
MGKPSGLRRGEGADSRCNDLTVPYPTGSISLTDPFVDHTTNHIDVQLDKSNCVVKYSFPPSEPHHPDMKEWTERRVKRLEEFERDRHRLPPFIVLPLPGPFKHVRSTSTLSGFKKLIIDHIFVSAILLAHCPVLCVCPLIVPAG